MKPGSAISLLGTFLLALLAPQGVAAQVGIDRPLILTGAAPADRQVTGLTAPVDPEDAMQAGTLQNGSHLFAAVTGQAWNVNLEPAPTTVQRGTRLTLLSQDSITGPVTVQVNGQGPFDVVKDGAVPLNAGDVRAGAMVELLFDGTAFHLISGRASVVRDCPTGFVPVNQRYCIGQVQHDTLAFDQAAAHCASLDATLCTWGEWYNACTKAAQLGITDLTGDWEWTNDAASADGYVRQVGNLSCSHTSVKLAFGPPGLRFRCCMRR
ncbi:MAG: hypothetical protein JNL05_01685 [Flavobacteriales bacterium]|nr:hypothetical protein [Flavobacteriales bacterium]